MTVTHQVLAAVRPVDAVTGAALPAQLLAGPGQRWTQGRSGVWVLLEGDLDGPPQELRAVLRGPNTTLPRSFSLTLPRDPTPGAVDGLGVAVEIPLYPSPTAAARASWAAIRAQVTDERGEPLGGALLRLRIDGKDRAWGQSDARGEALVLVPGLPVATWSTDTSPGASVLNRAYGAEVDVVHDLDEPNPPDLDRLHRRWSTLPRAQRATVLSAGARVTLEPLNISSPQPGG